MPSNKILDKNALLAVKDYVDIQISSLHIPPVKYQHNICFKYSNISISFSFISNSSTALTYDTLGQALYSAGFNSSTALCPAGGFSITSSAMRFIVGVYGKSNASKSDLGYKFINIASLSSTTATIQGSLTEGSTGSISYSTSWTVHDIVVSV